MERISVALDIVLVTADQGALWTLLVKRSEEPFEGRLAIPGGFVRADESLDEAAVRILREKAGLSGIFTEQLYTFGDLERDPRGRIVTVAYLALVHADRFRATCERSGGRVVGRIAVPWEGETGGAVDLEKADGSVIDPAFDHDEILGMAVKRLRGRLDYSPIGFQLLPERFTLMELQTVHETVLGSPVNKDSFRRRMLASGDLEATGTRQENVGHRPAQLYRFARRSAL
jgi:8-oxo-dGTP diphosphatase